MIKKNLWVWALVLFSSGPAHASDATLFGRQLEAKAVRYFLENTHPQSGLTLDRANNFGPIGIGRSRTASISATGFGMVVLANASLKGMVAPDFAQDHIQRALETALKLDQRAGWLYHFIDWETGARIGTSEISTIDSAIFFAGALYAAQIFPHGRIAQLAEELYRRADFIDMMTDGGAHPEYRTLSMGWKPEIGYLPSRWDHYSELMLLVIMGLGHPTNPLPPDVWEAWQRPELNLPWGQFLIGPNLPLFAHQYSHLFIDFRPIHDSFTNYFTNSVLATQRDRTVSTADNTFAAFRAGFWGNSAGDSPRGYRAVSTDNRDGTVCPGCAGASAMFDSKTVLADMESWSTGIYRDKLWGNYGFVDSVNLDSGWFDSDVIGITVGALYLSLANLDTTAPPNALFTKIPWIASGLARAGFLPSP